ncbi:amino acid permease-domain-containing protein [Aspergillus cavernicola]|uniref:Amino acid permease-domain-containing protein n=1 Tax=Aspergillus cavernicola TaxID=176166 RepID=A0ABR4HH99_9EURO
MPNDGEGVSTGTFVADNIDDIILRANGHTAELKRQFNWLSALGLGFSITNSWVGYLSNFGQNMAYGGPHLVIIGLVSAFVVQSIITIGLTEIGSAFPVLPLLLLSPDKTERFSRYIIGWMSVVAWWIVISSGISLAATILAGMINFFNPDFVATQWQIYFLSVATAVITIIPVFSASKRVAFICQISLLMSIVGCILTLFVTVGTHKHVYLNDGICNGMYAFGSTDGALHISEEMQHPGRRVLQIIIATLIIGIATTLPLFIALLLFSSDADAIVNSPSPSAELIYQACGGWAGTIFLITWLLVVYISCLPSQWVTSSRIAWALARDVTFHSIITSAVLVLNISYAIPQGILMFQGRRRQSTTSSRWFKYVCNTFSVVWVVILGVFVSFPPAVPVGSGNINHTAVIPVGLFGFLWCFGL